MSVDFRTTYTSLLKEPEVGKVRSPSYTLPDDSFTYGQFVSRDKEGAGEGLISFLLLFSHIPFPSHQ